MGDRQRATKLLLAGVAESLTVIDLRDLKEDQSLHLLRVSLPVGDRSLTLYEEVHPQRSIVNRQLHHQFLRRQAAIMPARAAPIVVADSGCTDPNQGAALR